MRRGEIISPRRFFAFSIPQKLQPFFFSVSVFFLRSAVEKIINRTDIENVIEYKIDKQQFWAWPA